MNTSDISELIKASYSTNNNARNIGNKLGYRLDDQFSNRNQKVFYDDNKKENPIIVYTGTRKASDWLTNSALALGLQGTTNRFQHAKTLANKVKQKYNSNATIIGDSLGGGIAEHVGRKNDKIITTSKGVGLGGIGKKIKSNQTDIRAKNDIVSVLSLTQKGGRQINLKGTGKIIDQLASHDFRLIKKYKKKI